jgi:hypothetical protein
VEALPPAIQAGHDQLVGPLRATLGEDAYAAAWAAGQAMPPAEAVALALEDNPASITP